MEATLFIPLGLDEAEGRKDLRKIREELLKFCERKREELREYIKKADWEKAKEICELVRDAAINTALAYTPQIVVELINKYHNLNDYETLAVKGALTFALYIVSRKYLRNSGERVIEKRKTIDGIMGDRNRAVVGYFKALGKSRPLDKLKKEFRGEVLEELV